MYYPKYVLFNDGVKDITVDMAIEALNYMIKIILSKKPLTNSYKKSNYRFTVNENYIEQQYSITQFER